MKRDALFPLLAEVRKLLNDTLPVVVGSQSAYGQAAWLPAVVKTSLEVDIMLKPEMDSQRLIRKRLGMDSPYHAEHGVYADPLGIGIVSLPPHWEDRLVEVRDDAGELAFLALELHDTAVSKLMAGREKDFEFLTELLLGGVLQMERFLERALQMRDTVHVGALRPRLQRLRDVFMAKKLPELTAPVMTVLLSLP
jgi:hypothetical protein